MPLFKKSPSKGDASKSGPAPDVVANDKKDDPPQIAAVTADGPIPEYSDNLKEVYAVAYREIPQVRGVEGFLNKIHGTSIMRSSVHDSPPRSDRRYVSPIQC